MSRHDWSDPTVGVFAVTIKKICGLQIPKAAVFLHRTGKMVLLHDVLCIGQRSANRNPMLNLCHCLRRPLGKLVTVRASADGEHDGKYKNSQDA